jgi:ATP phosphoribosyltransferase regulatory subunit
MNNIDFFKNAGYGMMMHFGLYSILGGEYKGKFGDNYAEWIGSHFAIPIKEYEQLAKVFNPIYFNADEVISLAKSSLESISKDYVLEISHMGVIFQVLNKISDDKAFYEEALECIEKKSTHEIKAVCAKYGLNKENETLLSTLVTLYGKPSDVISRLDMLDKEICFGKCLDELKTICALLGKDESFDKIRLDFSIVNDMKYYNGIVINGYVNGVCECVLYGGSYDKLLSKMGKGCRGIGFAIYTDLLNQLNGNGTGYDVDTLIIYSDETSACTVREAIEKEIASGKSVSAQKSIPKKLRYREIKEI